MYCINNPNTTSGFTLLEMLLAVLIFALIILGAQQTSSLAIESASSLKDEQSRLKNINLFLETIERDLTQLTSRPTRYDITNSIRHPLETDVNSIYWFRLTRAGWKNPLQRPRSNIQSATYYFEDNKIFRSHQLFLDGINNNDPVKRKLLENVNSVEINFLSRNGQWSDTWPIQNQQNITNSTDFESANRLPEISFPVAVEIKMELKDYGTISKLLNLATSA